MGEPDYQTFDIGNVLRSELGQNMGSAPDYIDSSEGMTPEQFQNFSGGLNHDRFEMPEFSNQGGILQQLQRLHLQQNAMTGSPFSFQGGIPQQLQNIRNSLGQTSFAGLGTNFPGMDLGNQNNAEEEEDEDDINWDEIFEQTFFPNGRPAVFPDPNNFRMHCAIHGTVDSSADSVELNNARNQADQTYGNIYHDNLQGDPSEVCGAQAMSDTFNASRSGFAEGDINSMEHCGMDTGLKRKESRQESSDTDESTRKKSKNIDDEIVAPFTPKCDFTELLQKEREKALTFEDVQEDSQCTIILLDSSINMKGEPIEAAQTAIRAFVTGLADIPDLKENVSLVTFGEELSVHQHLTCDYSKILWALDNVRLHGQASVSHGLALCVPVLERLTRPGMNGVICHPRIVIVSDFKMTVADDNQTISQKLLVNAEDTVKNLQDSYHVTVFCVPVVTTYQRAASQIARVGDGTVISAENIQRLCHFYLQRLLAGYVLGEPDKFITNETIHCAITTLEFEKYIDDEDVAMIKKIIQTTAPHRMEFLTDTVPDPEVPGTSSQQGACGVERSKIPDWQRCLADAEDSSNPNSEYSDSECSILDSGLENDERDFMWLWRDDQGEWKNYSDKINKKLEKTYRRKPRGTCVVPHNGQAERVLFKVMKQRSSTLKKERDVQRLEVDPEMMKQLQSQLYGEK